MLSVLALIVSFSGVDKGHSQTSNGPACTSMLEGEREVLNEINLTLCKDQGGTGTTGHKGTDSSLIEQRVKPFGNWQDGIGENLAYRNDSARERVLTWLVDDGFPSRGHRTRMTSPNYKVAGVSCGLHPDFQTMCVLTLAGGFVELQPAKTATSTQTNSNTNTNSNKSKPATKKSKKP